MLKKLLLFSAIFLFIIPLTSCHKSCPCNSDDKISLEFISTDWYTTTSQNGELTFGNVMLRLRGKTNADVVTVKTFGDGLISEHQLTLDANKNFEQVIMIAFTHQADNKIRYFSTTIKAIIDADTLEKTLNSGPLQYVK
jgi:hypothetical protein